MKKENFLTENDKQLTRRYFIWCYKTTKESLDRIDRYFTQLKVDKFILDVLKNNDSHDDDKYTDRINEFSNYMQKKEANVLKKKFEDADKIIIKEEYKYLTHRFKALEEAICHFFDKDELREINALYELEMTQRILSAKEHG